MKANAFLVNLLQIPTVIYDKNYIIRKQTFEKFIKTSNIEDFIKI